VQAQLSSSDRLEMAVIERWLLKINYLKICHFWGFFIFGFLLNEYIQPLAAVIKHQQTKTAAILLKRNQLYMIQNPLLASQYRLYSFHLLLMAGYIQLICVSNLDVEECFESTNHFGGKKTRLKHSSRDSAFFQRPHWRMSWQRYRVHIKKVSFCISSTINTA